MRVFAVPMALIQGEEWLPSLGDVVTKSGLYGG
jgi:hypothetical protein